MLDSSSWSNWGGYGNTMYSLTVKNLSSGKHSLHIQVCYDPIDGEKIDSLISFVRIAKPVIAASTDTLLTVDFGARCTLWVKASGAEPLTYTWYADTVKLTVATGDTLVIDSATVEDAHKYHCRVNDRWNTISSSTMRVAVVFCVYYDGNGQMEGKVPVDSNRYEQGALATALGNTGNLKLRGFTFDGWSPNAGNSGTARDSGDLFRIGKEHCILYARWIPNALFSLTYNGNGNTGGKVPDTARSYKTGELVNVASNSGNLVRKFFSFTGWNTAKDGSETTYNADSTMEMGDKNSVLYAQ